MNRTLNLFVLAVIALAVATTAQAAIIHESATLGPTGQEGGLCLGCVGATLGSRFSLERAVNVESVGGHIGGGAPLFAAIIPLTSSTALPELDPPDLPLLASTVFTHLSSATMFASRCPLR
jgi:hypothetical protein